MHIRIVPICPIMSPLQALFLYNAIDFCVEWAFLYMSRLRRASRFQSDGSIECELVVLDYTDPQAPRPKVIHTVLPKKIIGYET